MAIRSGKRKKELNQKQKIFVEEYLISRNATQAAKAAGYSVKTAYAIGHKLLKVAEIKAEIEKRDELQLEKSKVRAAMAGLTRERWLQELQLIALSNMDNFAVIEELEETRGRRGRSYPIQTVRAIATKDRHKNLGRVIKKISETKNGIGIELHSKQSALELLGKHYGWLKNEVELTTPNSVQINLTMPSNGREVDDDNKE